MKHLRARAKGSGKTYYYFDTGGKPRREIPLGSDYVLAVQKWSALMVEQGAASAAAVSNFEQLARAYETRHLPTLAASTQATQRSDLKHLRAFFCAPQPAPLAQIKPKHLHQLLQRHIAQPTTANRLKRTFSAMFNLARDWGYTDTPNPTDGVRGLKVGKRRQNYVTDAVKAAIWQAGAWPLRDAMDLAYLTADRRGDVLKATEAQIVDGELHIAQGKTGKRLRVQITGELAALLERIKARKAGHKVWASALLVNEWGHALTKQTLRTQWEDARTAAATTAAAAGQHALAAEIKGAWFKDLRAKASNDVADQRGEQAASDLLGHEKISTMQRHYSPRGRRVGPTK